MANAHKKIRSMIGEEAAKITDEMFFTSKEVKRHFEDVAAACCGRYASKVKIRVNMLPKSEHVAYTDDRKIYINTSSEIVAKGENRREKFQLITGIFGHELGHVLYTDFASEMTWDTYFFKGTWYPRSPELNFSGKKAAKEIFDYASKPENQNLMRNLFHQISNILEDGYIEIRLLHDFPGTIGSGLRKVRKIHFESIPTVAEEIKAEEEKGGHVLLSIFQNLLAYAKFGEIKYGGVDFSNERISAVFDVIDDVDDYIDCHNGRERLMYFNSILVKLWPYIKSYIDFVKEKAKEEGKSASDVSDSMTSGMSGTSEAPSGKSSAPITEEPDDSSSSPTSSKRKKTAKDKEKAEGSGEKKKSKRGRKKKSESGEDEGTEKKKSKKSASENEEDKDGSKGSDPSEDSKDSEDSAKTESDSGSSDSESKEGDGSESSGSEDSSSDDSGSECSGSDSSDADSDFMPPDESSDSDDQKGEFDHDAYDNMDDSELVEYDGDAETEYDENYEAEENERADKEIEDLLEEMAEKAAESKLEDDRLSELQDFSDAIDYGRIHDGLTKKIFRQSTVDDSVVERYNAVAPELIKISKRLQKSILQQIKDARMGGRNYGLYMGKRLDRTALYRNDGRLFYKTNLPEDVPRLAVGLLLDESGSMCSGGRDITARATGIILYDFCRALDIPICIYGHSTYDAGGRENIALYAYSEFDEIDKNDKYRLMDVHARADNRDGAALRFVAERLMTRPEEEKILIIVSDGAPAAIGYYGDKPKGELQAIKREYTRKGILFQAAAIGDDKKRISEIYGDSFLDITDLNELPILLTKVIKRHIRC